LIKFLKYTCLGFIALIVGEAYSFITASQWLSIYDALLWFFAGLIISVPSALYYDYRKGKAIWKWKR